MIEIEAIAPQTTAQPILTLHFLQSIPVPLPLLFEYQVNDSIAQVQMELTVQPGELLIPHPMSFDQFLLLKSSFSFFPSHLLFTVMSRGVGR